MARRKSEETWGSEVEKERWRRIHVLLWAYAYEFKNESFVDDHTFDKHCYEIDLSVDTGKWDEWFKEKFSPFTGQWIHDFPDLLGIECIYLQYKSKFKKMYRVIDNEIYEIRKPASN